MITNVSDLEEGAALDWAVAKCNNLVYYHNSVLNGVFKEGHWFSGYHSDPNIWTPLSRLRYSTNWSLGGPIADLNKIDIRNTITKGGYRTASSMDAVEAIITLPNGATVFDPKNVVFAYGPTLLVAAMRCFVISVSGHTIDVPVSVLTYPCYNNTIEDKEYND